MTVTIPPRKKTSVDVSTLAWTDPSILFDGSRVIGAQPAHDAVATQRRPGEPARPKGKVKDDGRRDPNDTSDYTIAQAARELNISPETASKKFGDEPGVINLGTPDYKQLRIPVEVFKRVKARRAQSCR